MTLASRIDSSPPYCAHMAATVRPVPNLELVNRGCRPTFDKAVQVDLVAVQVRMSIGAPLTASRIGRSNGGLCTTLRSCHFPSGLGTAGNHSLTVVAQFRGASVVSAGRRQIRKLARLAGLYLWNPHIRSGERR